jgi:hypothetical protein
VYPRYTLRLMTHLQTAGGSLFVLVSKQVRALHQYDSLLMLSLDHLPIHYEQ